MPYKKKKRKHPELRGNKAYKESKSISLIG
jgi:hypothetical protein